MKAALLQRTAQAGALVVLAAAGAAILSLVAVAVVTGVLVLGPPVAFAGLGAATWPMVRACLREALGCQPGPPLGLPGWAWLAAGGTLLGASIA